jgi:hypothetical protein
LLGKPRTKHGGADTRLVLGAQSQHWVSADVLVCHPLARGEVGWLPRPANSLQIANSHLQSAIQKGPKVSNYTVEELIARWKREELTIEQAIGQILLLLKEQEQRLREAAPPHDRRAGRNNA